MAQTDTSFWFAAPDVSSVFDYDKPVLFRISSYQLSSQVTISVPANPAFPVQTLNIPPFTTQSIDLTNWLNLIECGPGNVIQNKGIKIASNNKIAVCYEVDANGPNPELFALKGRNALGNQFYISSQYLLSNTATHSPTPLSSFNIVATENNTSVTIRPSANITGHPANVSFTINLNRGQTYAAIATSTLAAQHLQGSVVNSDKPIAITLADDLLQGLDFGGICEDLAGDQTVPVNIIGSEYIAFRSDLNNPDKLYITAVQNGTIVKQDGIVVSALNAGQSAQLDVVNNTSFIQSSAPAYAYHLAGVGCEVGSAVLPKITCTGSSSVSITRSTVENFIVTLLVKNGAQGGFTINGSSSDVPATIFAPVPFTSGAWYWAKIYLSLSEYPNGSVIKFDNSLNVFQLGVLQGGSASGAGYGYFSDYNTLQANATTTTPSVCVGSPIRLSGDTISSATYSWTGPNNFSSSQQNIIINNTAAVNSGSYILNVTVPNCGTYADTINITVKAKVFSNLNPSICAGGSFAGYSISGVYIDTLAGSNGCDSIRTINLFVQPPATSTVNRTVCQGTSFEGYSVAGTYIDTLVANNGCDSIRTLNLVISPRPVINVTATICQGESYFGYTNSGTYTDTITAPGGCDSIRTLQLLVAPANVTTEDKVICRGQSYLGYSTPGIFRYTIQTALGCDSIKILNLSVADIPNPQLLTDKEICTGEFFTLDPGSFSNSVYLWNNGASSQTISISEAGLYSVSITNICGTQTANTTVKVNPCNVVAPNVFTPNADGINDVFRI